MPLSMQILFFYFFPYSSIFSCLPLPLNAVSIFLLKTCTVGHTVLVKSKTQIQVKIFICKNTVAQGGKRTLLYILLLWAAMYKI